MHHNVCAHSASQHTSDWVDETGLSSSSGPIKKNPEPLIFTMRFVVVHTLQIWLFASVQETSQHTLRKITWRKLEVNWDLTKNILTPTLFSSMDQRRLGHDPYHKGHPLLEGELFTLSCLKKSNWDDQPNACDSIWDKGKQNKWNFNCSYQNLMD